jgi:hypothetical protein
MHIFQTVLISIPIIGLIPAIAAEELITRKSDIVVAPTPVKSSKDLIQGDWDLGRVKQIILPRLQNHTGERGDTDHRVLSQYKLPYKKKNARLVITASIRLGSDCFACSKDLSFFEFEKRNGEWQLVSSHLEVERWGHYGIARPEGISIEVIGNNGDNIYGVMLQSFVSHGGSSNTSTTIYAMIGRSLRSVFPTIDTSGGNLMGAPEKGKETNWDSKITILPRTGSKGFFNILVKSEGIRRGKSFTEKKLFKFNGQKYVAQTS